MDMVEDIRSNECVMTVIYCRLHKREFLEQPNNYPCLR